MITSVSEERMLVISDVHLGNPLFRARLPAIQFFKYAYENDYCLCINGDGIDILQTSIIWVTRDLSECSSHLRKFTRKGLHVYYVVGNHDIILENFLDDWGIVQVVPFLNVVCGNKRIRIEHGHLYDEFFVRAPRVYTAVTLLGGIALRIHPRVYRGFESVIDVVVKLNSARVSRRAGSAPEHDQDESIPNERPCFREAAAEIARRGFDAVIFGHTHCSGQAKLDGGKVYMNTGSWLFRPHYVELNQGDVTLKPVLEPEKGPLRQSWTTLMEQMARRWRS